jgi:integrase
MIAEGLAASSISKRIGSLARAVDWGARIGRMPQERNPVRMLPRGFATRQVSKDKLWAGERDRRLNSEAEEAALRKVLDEEEEFLFDFALETSMRLSEIIGLLWSQISLGERTIYLRSTKNGRKRQVPITRPLLALLKKRKPSANEGDAPVFSRWFGRPSWVVSCMFHNRVKKAGIVGLRFHDLRHEATSRLYERTRLTDVQIASITGHVELRMLRRYANLRASTLVEEMW